jgi:DNA-binding transcriptional ArsR family regulator
VEIMGLKSLSNFKVPYSESGVNGETPISPNTWALPIIPRASPLLGSDTLGLKKVNAMTVHQSTTPFGRRPLSLAMVAARAVSEAGPKDALAEKWKVLDNLREAKAALGISDRALSVLNALLTFHQDTTLQLGSDLIVFPSNRALILRANGMSPSTLRRHLAALVLAGLVIRRDSPNGKRYARKGEGGSIEQAFGFDLSPLVARAAEFESLAEAARAERRARYLLREEITVLRRDIGKTIAVALDEDLAGPWDDLLARFDALNETPPRSAETPVLEAIAVDLRALWADVDNALRSQLKSENMNSNESQNGRHYQSSKPDPLLDSEQGLRERLEASHQGLFVEPSPAGLPGHRDVHDGRAGDLHLARARHRGGCGERRAWHQPLRLGRRLCRHGRGRRRHCGCCNATTIRDDRSRRWLPAKPHRASARG